MGDTANSNEWVQALPEDVRNWEEARSAGEDPSKFWKQIGDIRSRIGRSITPPREDATPEERATFYEKLTRLAPDLIPRPNPEDEDNMTTVFRQMGMPETPDGYEMEVPEGLDIPDERKGWLRGVAAKNKLTKSQFNGLMKDMLGHDAEQLRSRSDAVKADRESLVGEWGADYDRRMAKIANLAERSGAPASITEAARNKTLSSADAKWLLAMAERMGGEGTETAGQGDSAPRLIPTEARARIDAIRRDKTHPFNDRSHRDHQKWVNQEMPDLYRLANGKSA